MASFERFVIPRTATLEQAMRRIDQSGGMIALIAEDRRLLGVVSNGDIRRALLAGSGPERLVVEVMNSTPLTLRAADRQNPVRVSEVIIALEDKNAHGLPVVDDEGRLVELLRTDELEALHSRSLRASNRLPPLGSRVLLVGGAGYIGSVLARRLLEERFAVRVADRLLYGREPIQAMLSEPRFEFHRCDFRHIENMIDLVTDVDAVVYLAEIVGDPACALDPSLALETNFVSVQAFATLCSHLQVNRFVYLSSCSVYGASANPDDWLDEESPLNPVSLYARIKIMTERALVRLGEENANFSPTILRLATVFGMSSRPRFDLVVNRLTAHAVREGAITIWGGDQWRPNVHVHDVAQAIAAVLQAPLERVRGRVLNVGDNALNLRVRELGDLVATEVPGTRVQVVPDMAERRNYRVAFDRIQSLLGFKVEASVVDGIREVSEFLRTHPIDFRSPRFTNS